VLLGPPAGGRFAPADAPRYWLSVARPGPLPLAAGRDSGRLGSPELADHEEPSVTPFHGARASRANARTTTALADGPAEGAGHGPGAADEGPERPGHAGDAEAVPAGHGPTSPGGSAHRADEQEESPADPTPTWEEIAEQYGGTVYTMAYRLTGDRDEARDLAQDVFVRVYRNLDRYRPGTFEGWLYRITKNLFLDRVRRRNRVRVEPLPEGEWRQPSDLAPGPADRLEAGMLRGDLELALQDLPPLFRTAVVLCDVHGLSYEEVAEATGWPLGTVRSRIHRGRRLLRRRLDGGGRG
jgi:RNA polymerase sigma-70 factor, ECF subfamily